MLHEQTYILFLIMLFLLLLHSIVIAIDGGEVQPDMNPKDRVVVKLDTDQVIDAFKSAMSTEYLRGIAHILAVKAAEQFLRVMKNVQPATKAGLRQRLSELAPALLRRPAAASIKAEVVQEIEGTEAPGVHEPSELNTSIIDVNQAMTLIKDPSPDGDNLDLISPNLSEEEEFKEKKNGAPVISLLKVNGKYVRRLLGFI